MACDYDPYRCDIDDVFNTPCEHCLGQLLAMPSDVIEIRPGVWLDQTEPSVFLRLLNKKKGPVQ